MNRIAIQRDILSALICEAKVAEAEGRQCDWHSLSFAATEAVCEKASVLTRALEAVDALLAEARERGGALSEGEKLGCAVLALATAASGENSRSEVEGEAPQSGPNASEGNAQ